MSLVSLFVKEGIALVAVLKRAMRANRSCCSLPKEQQEQLLFRSFALSLFRSQKTSDFHEKPKSEFPTLPNLDPTTDFYYLKKFEILIFLQRKQISKKFFV